MLIFNNNNNKKSMKKTVDFKNSVIVLAIGIFAVSCGGSENKQIQNEATTSEKKQTAESIMPDKSYIGTWHDAYNPPNDLTILEIGSMIKFELGIYRITTTIGTAKIENNKIVFVTDCHWSGTIEFNENSILLTVDKSDPNILQPGTTYNFTVKEVVPKEELKNTEQIIEQIRAEYAIIVANKGKYKTKVVMEEQHNIDGGGSTETYVTLYFDKDENIRIMVYTDNHYGDDGSAFTVKENYLKDDHIFFVYQREKKDHTPACPNGECYQTTITEKRVYYENDKCFKYLVKQVSGKYSEASALENLLKKTPNIEQDCESVELFHYE
jgi:hypothetical protein